MSVSNLKPSDSTKVQLLTDAQSDLLKNSITFQDVEDTSFFDNEEYSLTVGSFITTSLSSPRL